MDGRRVKKGDVIAYALEKMNIKEYSQAVMIGDREHDIIGAKEHGLSCIGVLYGYGSREEFERYQGRLHCGDGERVEGRTVILKIYEEFWNSLTNGCFEDNIFSSF